MHEENSFTDEVVQELKDETRDLAKQPLVYETSPNWIGPPRATKESVVVAFVTFSMLLHERLGRNADRHEGFMARIKLFQVLEVLLRHICDPDDREVHVTYLWYLYEHGVFIDHAELTSCKDALKAEEFEIGIELVLDMIGMTRRDMRLRIESEAKIASSAINIRTLHMVYSGGDYAGITVPDTENFELTITKPVDWIFIVENYIGHQLVDVGFSHTAIPGTTGVVIYEDGPSTVNGRSLLHRIHQVAGRIVPVAIGTNGDYEGQIIANSWMEPMQDRDDVHKWERDEYLDGITRIAMKVSKLSSKMGLNHSNMLPSLPQSDIQKLKSWRDQAHPSLRQEIDWMIKNKKSASITIVETNTYADVVNGGKWTSMEEHLKSELQEWWNGLPEDMKHPAVDCAMDSGEA